MIPEFIWKLKNTTGLIFVIPYFCFFYQHLIIWTTCVAQQWLFQMATCFRYCKSSMKPSATAGRFRPQCTSQWSASVLSWPSSLRPWCFALPRWGLAKHHWMNHRLGWDSYTTTIHEAMAASTNHQMRPDVVSSLRSGCEASGVCNDLPLPMRPVDMWWTIIAQALLSNTPSYFTKEQQLPCLMARDCRDPATLQAQILLGRSCDVALAFCIRLQ